MIEFSERERNEDEVIRLYRWFTAPQWGTNVEKQTA